VTRSSRPRTGGARGRDGYSRETDDGPRQDWDRQDPRGYADRGARSGREAYGGRDGYGDRSRRDWQEGDPRVERGGRGPARPGSGGPGGGKGGKDGNGGMAFNPATLAVLAGVLIVGIGIGTAISSTTQGDQGNIASSQQLDMAVPDPEFCRQWGASAFVMDIELYTTMNPSSSFVTQPSLKPGCVIRRENWSVLQKEGAITAEQMRQCKQRMNTFAYIGSVKDKPIVRCVYQTDITENKFITKGVAADAAGVTPEADQF
jgi:hypothetical protein